LNDEPCIMLIRHAEGPREGEPGIDPHGQPDDHGLSVEGWQRAGALVHFFAPAEAERPAHPQLARPRHLVALRSDADHPSTRPRDTLLPLASALGLEVDDRWGSSDALSLVAHQLRALEAAVLVSWRHQDLPALANELLQRPDAPNRWPEDRHDVVWVVSRAGLSWSFAQVPQRLLAGDRPQAIARRVSASAARGGRAGAASVPKS
jgi:broad specificity phosphatase PhoE